MRGETLEPLVYLTSKLRSLEGKLTRAQAKRLVALPAQLGYSSTEEFISAFREAIAAEFVARSNDLDDCSVVDAEPHHETVVEDGSEVPPMVTDDTAAAADDGSPVAREVQEDSSSEGNLSANPTFAESESSGPSDGTSTEVESEVKRLLEAGKSRAEISRILGISEAKVRSVKKALGLVQNRTKTGTKSKKASSGSSRKRKGSKH